MNFRQSKQSIDTLFVEPGYYWRLYRDSSKESKAHIPNPLIVSFQHDDTISNIEKVLSSSSLSENSMKDSIACADHPRIVIHMRHPTSNLHNLLGEQLLQESWANHSVGRFDSWKIEKEKYVKMPIYRKENIDIRLCAGILDRIKGNRSCFDKCK